MQRPPTLSRRAFTLIEVLVVIVVIAILATFVAPSLFRNVNDARVATAKAQIESFGTALDAYRLDNGRYPTTTQGLAAAWQRRPYLYVAPGTVNPASYDLLTYGADGKPGGDRDNADITSWK